MAWEHLSDSTDELVQLCGKSKSSQNRQLFQKLASKWSITSIQLKTFPVFMGDNSNTVISIQFSNKGLGKKE